MKNTLGIDTIVYVDFDALAVQLTKLADYNVTHVLKICSRTQF